MTVDREYVFFRPPAGLGGEQEDERTARETEKCGRTNGEVEVKRKIRTEIMNAGSSGRGGGGDNNNNNKSEQGHGDAKDGGHDGGTSPVAPQTARISPEKEKGTGERMKSEDSLWPKPRPPVGEEVGGTDDDDDDEVFTTGSGPRAYNVETSDEEETSDGSGTEDDLDCSGFYPTRRVTGITPLMPSLGVDTGEPSESVATSEARPTPCQQELDKPPLPTPRNPEHGAEIEHLNSFGDRRTILKRGDITKDYIAEIRQRTGRPVKVKEIGGGLVALEFAGECPDQHGRESRESDPGTTRVADREDLREDARETERDGPRGDAQA